MRMRKGAGVMTGALVLIMILSGCTGGQEGSAAEEQLPNKNPIASSSAAVQPQQAPQIDPRQQLKALSAAIPIYAGAKYRDDLTRRDSVMIKNQYGQGSEVYTLATDDSFPQVYHYYTTYLAQFRAYPSQPPYPPPQNWRTLEVQLNQAMQDPFIPGDMLRVTDKQVMLQVAETEAEPKTVIRYIITPQSQAQPTTVAAAGSQ
jgi:hypothetical protein